MKKPSLHSKLLSLTLFVCSSLGVLVSTQLLAQPQYYSETTCGQSSCHDYLASVPSAIVDPTNPKDLTSSMPATCTGCHAHGTQSTALPTGLPNMQALLFNNQFRAGDTITVAIYGGNNINQNGWFKATLYDANGRILDSNLGCLPTRDNCKFPVQLLTTAQAGMNRLYVGWLGRNHNKFGGQESDTLGTAFGVGNRISTIDSNHIEVIVATSTFSVTGTSNSSKNNNDTRAGSGSLGGVFILVLLLITLLRSTLTTKPYSV